MRIGTGLLAIYLGLGVSGAASAQTVSLEIGTDSVLAILTGDTGTAELRVTNTFGVGVSAYDVTVFFDSSRVRLVRADSVPGFGLPSPTIAYGTNQATLTAAGTGSTASIVSLATLFFEMDGAALSGSFISLKVNSLTAGDGLTDLLPNHRTDVLDVCQAEQTWGDIDGSRTINSRDALITLTAAVGLSVGSFDAGLGDVDQDAQVTSRDALFILSAGIGLSVPSWVVVGDRIAKYCGPLEPAPSDVALRLGGGLWMIAAGDTIPVGLGVYAGAGSVSPPTWAPDGSKIAFDHSVSGLGNEIIAVARDGSSADTLSQNIYSDFKPSWSPDGTQIAFVSTRVFPQSIYLMDVDGGNQTRLTTTHTVFEIAWSPSASHIAFTGYDVNFCCSRRLWTYSLDSASVSEVFSGSNLRNPGYPASSPAGDKIVFHDLSAQRIDTVAAFAPGTATPGTPTPLFEWQEHPQWLSVGQAFISRVISTFRDLILHRASDGRHLRMTRNPAGQPRHPVFRAESPVYVDTVTVSPAAATLSVGGQPDPTTVQLTAAVRDNAGSPIIPRSGVTWTSSDPSIATVDQNGLVTAVAQGSVTITATTGGWRSGTSSVTVNP